MTIVEDALEAWREAERLLDRLPASAPDHEDVVLAVAALRQTYKDLTDGVSRRTPRMVADSRQSIDRTKALLARVHARMDGTAAT